MTSLTPNQACKKLANDLIVYTPSVKDWDLRRAYADLISKVQAAARSPNSPTGGITAATIALSIYFGRVAYRESTHGSELCVLLAKTTREVPFWRPYFGLDFRPSPEQNRRQMAGDAYPQLAQDPPDCVLEVARRILTRPWSEASSQLFRSALRLIANCCADNNLNRNVIVHRGGIELMMHLVRWQRECDLLLPTLFNVCIDFDEPAADADGESWKPLDQMQTEPYQESGPIVNAAEQRLGRWEELSDNTSSVEKLLDTMDHANGLYSTLADLVEMASRVTLYGVHNLISQLNGTESDDIVEASTISVIDALLTQGSRLIGRDPECCTSICQAIMNIFSQKATRQGLISVDGALWQLINLPYLVPTTDDEMRDSLIPYKKVILKLVYEVSASEAYGSKFHADTTLLRNCISVLSRGHSMPSSHQSPSYLADAIERHPHSSILVLISNSVVSTDRAAALLRAYPDLASCLTRLIQDVSDHEILHPAVDLATRLALCSDGQRQLYEAGILQAVSKVLNPTSEVNGAGIEVQRETVSLIRLVIKGHSEYTSALSIIGSPYQNDSHVELDSDNKGDKNQTQQRTQQSLAAKVFYLFYHTTDAATKTAIGRLVIEILRTLASALPAGRVGGPSTYPANNETQMISTVESRLGMIFEPISTTIPSDQATSGVSETSRNPAVPIAHIITEPQPQGQAPSAAQEAEAWFGLGLLSSFPSFHSSILQALAINEHQLLTRLKKIIAETPINASTPAPATSTTTIPPSLSSSITSGLDSLALTDSELLRSPNSSLIALPKPQNPPPPQQDARYANVKVLVVRMVQSHQGAAPTSQQTSASDSEEIKVVRDALEAAATDLGVDWVLV
ncbi:hypothetical protein LTR84_009777 [Exophiala bonariae]|uniref:ARM repeat-containing protein n=1 Tax=Exophiala bonariae TaxID=1690606 RepID=A0AAV9NJ68_9EURO|nr:hypothetical protein LTR84_009777 [Exophiala bonariae]